MAAANFGSTNFDTYYTVGMFDDENDYIQDDIDNVMDALEKGMKEAYQPENNLVRTYVPVYFGDIALDLCMEICVKYGYYQGAYFDIKPVRFAGYDISSVEDFDTDDLRDILYYQYEQNEGISKIHTRTLETRLAAAYENTVKRAANIIEQYTDKFVCLGHAGNGEAFYKHVA